MRLTGVGVGPGDPDLLTIKGRKLLRAADVVFVPVSAEGLPGYAEGVVLAHVDPAHVQRVVFALGGDADRGSSWNTAARQVAEVVGRSGHAAFATIGDPNLYSTFTYLAATVRRLVPGVAIDTVPGITAFQDLAARSGTVLAEGDQTLALLPFTAGRERLSTALAEHDTVVAHFKCSGTHSGEWLGRAATGRRFEDVDEIYIFTVRNGKLSSAIGVEDNLSRMRQLGIVPSM